MVRNYKRTTNQQSWSKDSMAYAIRDVRNGTLKLKAASLKYQIPATTLYRRVKSGKNVIEASNKSLGRFKSTFTYDQEKELAEFILEMESRLFGLSFKELRSLAYQYAIKNKIPNSFNHNTKLAGRDWVYKFLERQKNISLRLQEKTSAARASAFNPTNVGNFFNLLGSLFDTFHFPASRIFNCDETGISSVPNKPTKIFSLKGKKQIGCLSSAERGSLVSVEVCFSGAGTYVPPLLIFPRVRRNPAFENGLPPESIVHCHQSGWMQMDIFCDVWFPHFLKYARSSEESPVLLILDGHATHTKNLNLIEKAKANHVHKLVLPPHCSHRMQPLDVSFMYPLNTYYEQETRIWLRNNPGKVITLYEIGQLFGRAYQRAATLQTACNGFKNTGIYPYNPNIFPEDLFKPSETTNREEQHSEANRNAFTNSEANGTISPRAGCSKERTPSPQVFSHEANNHWTPQDLLPLPRAGPRKDSVRGKRKGKIMILTSTPNMEEIKLQIQGRLVRGGRVGHAVPVILKYLVSVEIRK
ncbi:hypothetical protein Zmor_014462 [Zophobas morio]|uniref:HTH CENPB-type domain-containing protein n=1 Tax=Zophobas morio TaxID=2755281 RepID=A0AA38MG52_9CUCU|nr:hypothetical protein Zmor_014462 [Zophobas morio]